MDEKLKDEICKTACPIGYPRCSQGTSCLIPVRLEQAFRDAKWIETQQPEGELAPNPYQWALDQYAVGDAVYHDSVLMGKGFKNGSEAQLAHDKATMVKLPSEQECIDICRYLMQHSRNIRQGGQNLLKLLKESTWNTMK